jgi:transcriptional regulator GlxA family with amidase domain
LHLVRKRYGIESANRIARRLVVPPHRQGGQAQFIDQPIPNTERSSRLSVLIDEVRANLHLPHSLDSMAAKVLMSRRTFTRQFHQVTGATVGKWLLAERLALAQRLLEGSDQPIERVAEIAGFGASASLRQLFRRAFGVSPSAWRQTFKG